MSRGWGRVRAARAHAKRFGFAQTARHARRRLAQELRQHAGGRDLTPWHIGRRRAPYLPDADPDWPVAMGRLLRLAEGGRDGVLKQQDLDLAIARLCGLAHQRPDAPSDVVTVVIPCYEQTARLAACLMSILEESTGLWPRIIIVDDASPTARFEPFSAVPGVRVVRHDANQGYLRSVNNGVGLVDTPVVLTVNQDITVAPGWLEALLSGLADRSVGVVGPRIVGSNWRLAEAGGLLFRDGSAANRGRDRRADDKRYAYALDVDYVSGCCLATTTSLWRELGGLDEAFAPAYYEDADFCMRARQSGRRVRYLPGSVVVHAEGTSMGRDPGDTASLKHFQVRHREAFLRAHSSELATFPERPSDPADSEPRSRQPRCVVLPGIAPDPERDGGGVEVRAIVSHLIHLGWAVTLASEGSARRAVETAMRFRGARVTDVRDPLTADEVASSALVVSYGLEGGRAAQRLLTAPGHPPQLHFTGDVATRRLESLAGTGTLSDPHVGRWYAGIAPDPDTTWTIEADILRGAALSVFVTDCDLDYAIDRGFDGPSAICPVMRDQEPDTGPIAVRRAPTIGFVGSMTHGPNVDAVRSFLAGTWGLVLQRVPNASLELWGSGFDKVLTHQLGQFPQVRIRGAYEDGAEPFAGMRVSIAPIRSGAGLKGKVLDAMLRGIPVVGTSVAFEGITLDDAQQWLILDEPEEIAEAIGTLLAQDDLWRSTSDAMLVAARTRYSPSAEREQMSTLVARALDTTRDARRSA